MQLHSHSEKLKCPYSGCEKTFNKLTALTDTCEIPRQTYYACPHCSSRVDVIFEGMKIVGVRATEYPRVFDSPAKCAHYFGFLNSLPEKAAIPDECLVCPKVLQCGLKRQR